MHWRVALYLSTGKTIVRRCAEYTAESGEYGLTVLKCYAGNDDEVDVDPFYHACVREWTAELTEGLPEDYESPDRSVQSMVRGEAA